MQTFVDIIFWVYVASFIVHTIDLMVSEYPKVKEESVGKAAAGAILALGLAIWVGIIKFL